MGVVNCFQISTISTITSSSSRGVALLQNSNNCHPHRFSLLNNNNNNNKQLNFTPSLSSGLSFSSSFHRSDSTRYPKSSIVCKARDAVDEVLVATDASWDTLVIACEKPVLVEFWAPWCGPCRMIAPVVDELAKEYAGKILCCKVNTDDCPNIATQYGIRSIPTVLFFKKGEKKESVIGAVPRATLSNAIDKYLDD